MALFAIPPNHPQYHRAVDAARDCLQAGVDIRNKHSTINNPYAWSAYCHWMLLHAPVTPFMGVFGHIVAYPHNSKDDLALLEDFVGSLRPVAHLSEGIARFHQLCAVFVQVAQAYIQAKEHQTLEKQREIIDTGTGGSLEAGLGASDFLVQFDNDLAALGFPVPQQEEILHGDDAVDNLSVPLSWTGLLEHDLYGFGNV